MNTSKTTAIRRAEQSFIIKCLAHIGGMALEKNGRTARLRFDWKTGQYIADNQVIGRYSPLGVKLTDAGREFLKCSKHLEGIKISQPQTWER